jgi:hypothetical protein
LNVIVCAFHADRMALAYCAGCGKALCTGCVVRLSTGNYCQTCAETPDRPSWAGHRGRSRVWIWAGLAIVALAAYMISQVL